MANIHLWLVPLPKGEMMALTDRTIKNAKLPKGKKRFKLSDRDGLYLLVLKSGKYFRYDYRHDGKRKTASFGVYPSMSLKDAREANAEAHRLLYQGIDPNQHKQAKKNQAKKEADAIQEATLADALTFEVVALEWHAIKLQSWTAKHAKTVKSRLLMYVFPLVGAVPVANLTRQQLADVIKAIIDRSLIETAKRMTQIIRQVLEYACDSGFIDAVPMGNMKRIIPETVAKEMPAILEPKRMGELLRTMHAYEGTYTVEMALKLLPYLFVRSTEFRLAKWENIDLEACLWTIPAADRKQKKFAKENPENVHLVPLASQAVDILSKLQPLTGRGLYVFPIAKAKEGIMSENTINKALHKMGFKGEMVGHGFRAMFRTCMIEQGFNEKVLELQMAHVEKNKTIKVYDRAEFIEDRIKAMQHWANYLDALRDGAKVIPIGKRA